MGAVVLLAAVALAAAPVGGESAVGSAGTDTELPPTDSKVTVPGRGPFGDVKFTVNQTKHLLNQAVTVSWKGAQPTTHDGAILNGNFMQIMQCWGDDDGTHPDNPGPPPEQCEFGATDAVPGGNPNSPLPNGPHVKDRVISESSWKNFDSNVGFQAKNGWVWRPFRAVDGTQVDVQADVDFNPDLGGGSYWLNSYFDSVTTNEIAGAATRPDGTGSVPFEIVTGIESTGLGCGQQVQPTDSGKRVPKCWLVIVPRGVSKDENVGTPADQPDNPVKQPMWTSPLAPAQWANRVSIPLDFTPVDTTCSLASDQTRLGGSELAAPAIFSWQPKLCENSSLQPFVYSTLNDASARQQLVQSPPGAPGLVVVSDPVDESLQDPDSPVVYAPLTLSGLVVAFNAERVVQASAPGDEKALATVPIAHINLTPRLLAKLLTQSYTKQVDINSTAGYPWEKTNPTDISRDPDFLQFNPEFKLLSVSWPKNFGGFMMPAGTSDVARQVWEYLLADPEAKAWLDGAADPWGMVVNPVYATTAAANSNGVAYGDPVPDSFAKSDPYCYQAQPQGGFGGVVLVPPSLCGTDWVPYTESFRDAVRRVRAADDRSKVAQNPTAQSVDQVWKRDQPQTLGTRAIFGLTDTASAFQYGVQTASLSRAGDDGDSRAFISADTTGLTAGLDAMKPGTDQAVLEPDPKASASGAYPLTVLTYAAIKPLALDAAARAQYSSFVDYAAGGGQAPGQDVGQLPPGYAPLPEALITQSQNAAKAIRELTAPAGDDNASTEGSNDEQAAALSDSSGSGSGGGSSSLSSSLASPTAISPIALSAPSRPTVLPKKTSPRGVTPLLSVAATRFVLPFLGGLALLSGLVALEITKRPRLVRVPPGEKEPSR
ncbi:MAG: hypothetical protein JO054_05830 [Actinobacteria bacterium]|nr:hypothetical protein [Actinomycetota bacterium]